MPDAVEQFRTALARRGILPTGGEIVADGRIHRCEAEGRSGKGDAAYLLHLDGLPAGGFENWRDGLGWQNWRADCDCVLSPAEEAAHRVRLENSRREREIEVAKRKTTVRKVALSVFEEAAPCDSHPYTARKGTHPWTYLKDVLDRLMVHPTTASASCCHRPRTPDGKATTSWDAAGGAGGDGVLPV